MLAMILTRAGFRAFPRVQLLVRKTFSYHTDNQLDKPVTMATQQPTWTAPKRATAEPVLKVFNSLTRTKVCSLGLSLSRRLKYHRQSLFQGTDATSSGIIVAQPFTMLHIWAMRGTIAPSPHCWEELTTTQKLCYAGYSSTDNDRLSRIRCSFCHEYHRHR